MAFGRSRLFNLAIALAALVAANEAAARFAHADADMVDPEERLSTETYNDKASYRFPYDWERLWRAHDVGFRVSAGSLTVNRFDYVEDLKLRAGDDGPVSVAFLQSRREDMVEQRQAREVRLGWQVAGPLRVEALGDGDTFKEYGDVGLALVLRRDRDHEVRAYFWSVDHYYATKKSAPDDERTRQPTSAGIEGRWQLGSDLAVAAAFEADHPLRWRRPGEGLGYEYDYARRELSYRAELEGLQGVVSYVEGRHEHKEEGKTWEAGSGELASKHLRRYVHVVELGGVRRGVSGDFATALELIDRDARYAQTDDPTWDPERSNLTEGRSPERSRRREAGLYSTWHTPLAAPRHYLLIGAQLNELRLEEDGDRATTEVKAQAAWDYRLTDAARLLLNTTWDLDQITDDFPYRERPFRPWGGGAIQIVATF
jgi:hypothetical protein